MEEEVKNKKTKVDNSSKIRKERELSSEELLQQILDKKKVKKTRNITKKDDNSGTLKDDSTEEKTKKKVTKKTTNSSATKKTAEKSTKDSTKKPVKETTKKTTKTTTKKTQSKKKVKTELSSDDLLSSIVEKKKNKVAKKAQVKEVKDDNKHGVYLNKDNIENSSNDVELFTKKDSKEEKPKVDVENITETLNTNSDDLIITRKIVFDDEKLNLKSKKTLSELRKAIEEFDRMETLSEIANSSDRINDSDIENSDLDNFDENIDTNADDEQIDEHDYLRSFGTFEHHEVRHRRRKKKFKIDKNIIVITLLVILLFTLLMIFVAYKSKMSQAVKTEPKVIDIINPKLELNSPSQVVDEKTKKYNDCMNAHYTQSEMNDDWNDYLKLTNYLEDTYKEKVSIAYENLVTGYSLSINTHLIYYAASTIKVLDALYLYTRAAAGEVNLDDTLVYESRYKYKNSKGMEQHNFGDKVSLRELVKYAIIYSDNSAHQMLVDYIGNSTLREFGLKLGARYTLGNLNEDFGNINVEDAIIYMKAVNDFINNNAELGAELKEMMITAEQNDLSMDELGIKAAHKYGSYSSYYHDYGIVYDEMPYIAVILTTEGLSGTEDEVRVKIRDINKHIYEYHKSNTDRRKNKCQLEVYGK